MKKRKYIIFLTTRTGILSVALISSFASWAAENPLCETQTVESATSTCAPYAQQNLCQPKVFEASNGVLQTALVVEKKWQCVPTTSGSGDATVISMTPKYLRNYGVEYGGQTHWNYPGPTFRLKRKQSRNASVEGDRFKMLFTNNLGPTTVTEQMKCSTADKFADDSRPNCFHGNETTNFHFHGFHISPQPLQDYVLLKLYPQNTPGIKNYDPLMSNETLKGFTSIGGSYRYDLDPLPYNQPEGTHWYHAHHHGATALQVLNGMAGTFLIEGPFDQWLNDYYGYNRRGTPLLKEKLMVIQEINDKVGGGRIALVNGQLNPIVSIAPGEVQRWRYVAASTTATAQLQLDFGQLQVRQIQMDGVQFNNNNYQRQPLLKNNRFTLSPGNRADFLVYMPTISPLGKGADQIGKRFQITRRVVGRIGEEAQEKINKLRKAMQNFKQSVGQQNIAPVDEIPLMTLSVVSPKNKAKLRVRPFPPILPTLPEFLAPPTASSTPTKNIRYEMFGGPGTSGNPARAPVFKIDGQQVRQCVPAKMTMTLNVNERWIVENQYDGAPATTNGINHPFHIHTNPFYVIRNGLDEYTNEADNFVNGIWQDTIRLPMASNGETGSDILKASSVDLRMEFKDYTGGYVQHCHILGHEDRGMMSLVQTICPNTDAFGTPVAGMSDNCSLAIKRLAICQ